MRYPVYAEILKKAIDGQGTTAYAVAKQLAERYDLPEKTARSTVYGATRGERVLSLEEAARVCVVLDLEPGALQPDLRQSSPSARNSGP